MKVRYLSTRAFVLRTTDFQEADVWLDLLTPRGLVRALAKNGRRSLRRFIGALESYAHVQASMVRRLGIWYLEETVVGRPEMALRRDLVALGLAGYAAEAFLTAWEPDEPGIDRAYAGGAGPWARAGAGDGGPFGTFEALIRQLGDPGMDRSLTLASLELRLLDLLGVAPELTACIACRGAGGTGGGAGGARAHETPLTHLDVEGGGALCGDHASRIGPRSVAPIQVQAGTWPLLRGMATAPEGLRRRLAPTASQRRALVELVGALAAWHRPTSGRAWRFLRSVLDGGRAHARSREIPSRRGRAVRSAMD